MSLRNKKTGEIGWLYCDQTGVSKKMVVFSEENNFLAGPHWEYDSLTELNAEWEDAPEEPKTINEIDVVLDAISEYCNEHSYYSGDLEKIKILNIVEDKLKAWKRLRDKGFRFEGYSHYDWNGNESLAISFEYPDFDETFDNKQVVADLDLLFSEEDD